MVLLLFSSTFIFFFSFWTAAAVVNRTIDDTIGDSVIRSRPLYLPSTPGVWEDATCKGCAVKPDPNQAFSRTWTAATYNPNLGSMSIELTFKGTAIYVFFILANFVADGITTETACNFTLNGREPVPFSHRPSPSRDMEYNALVYSQSSLSNDDHKLVISTSGITDRDIFVNFDYAIYTFDDTPVLSSAAPSSIAPSQSPATPSSSNPATVETNLGSQNATSRRKINVGVVVGSAIGGFVGLAAITLLLICVRCRKPPQRRRNVEFVIDEDPPPMAPSSTRTPFSIDVASTEERFRERPQTHSDFLQSGTILSAATAQASPYGAPDHDNNMWTGARPISRVRSHTLDTSQSSTISSSPYGGILSDVSADSSHTSAPLVHTRSNSIARSVPTREAVRRARQSEIDQQLRAARRELHDMNATKGSHRPTLTRFNPSQADEGELAEMREQMRLMREQIERLQNQRQSEWAQGLSDEPPPGYSPGPNHLRLRSER